MSWIHGNISFDQIELIFCIYDDFFIDRLSKKKKTERVHSDQCQLWSAPVDLKSVTCELRASKTKTKTV